MNAWIKQCVEELEKNENLDVMHISSGNTYVSVMRKEDDCRYEILVAKDFQQAYIY